MATTIESYAEQMAKLMRALRPNHNIQSWKSTMLDGADCTLVMINTAHEMFATLDLDTFRDSSLGQVKAYGRIGNHIWVYSEMESVQVV